MILARSLSRVTSFRTDFAFAALLQDCVRALLCLSSPLVDSGGIAEAVASFAVKFCTSLRTDARQPEVAAAARGCRLVITTTSQLPAFSVNFYNSQRKSRDNQTWQPLLLGAR